MSEMTLQYPIYFNGYCGTNETIQKLAEALPKFANPAQAFDFNKHGSLLSGNPFLSTK